MADVTVFEPGRERIKADDIASRVCRVSVSLSRRTEGDERRTRVTESGSRVTPPRDCHVRSHYGRWLSGRTDTEASRNQT
jgi:hypothetical protein